MTKKKSKQIKYGIYVSNANKSFNKGRNYWAFSDLLIECIKKLDYATITNKKGEFASDDINLAHKYLSVLEDERDDGDKDRLEVKVRR